MEFSTALSFSLPIGLALAAVGSGLGLGRAVGSAMDAMGRQPEAAGKIQVGMIIGAALIEALTIYSLVGFFILSGKIGAH
jgi:F-type H+-transporting ATPase subunit c